MSDKRECFKFKPKLIKTFPSISAIYRKYKYINNCLEKVMKDVLTDEITKRFTKLSRLTASSTFLHSSPPLLGIGHWSLWNLDHEVHPATIIIPMTIYWAIMQFICIDTFTFCKTPMKLVLLLLLLLSLVLLLLFKWGNQGLKNLGNLPKITLL